VEGLETAAATLRSAALLASIEPALASHCQEFRKALEEAQPPPPPPPAEGVNGLAEGMAALDLEVNAPPPPHQE
jgi:hypothetical protein